MHSEALTPATKRVLDALGAAGLTHDVYLAGGSALALYFGHRFSVDLDWFGERFKFTDDFRSELSSIGSLTIHSSSPHTFHGTLANIEVSFFRYPYKLIFPKTMYKENIFLASEQDIACMKLDAIATRGTRKDFIDLYFLLQRHSLAELVEFMERKYSGIHYNTLHLLKSLTYFDDAETSAPVEMIASVTWREVKRNIERAVAKFTNAS